jgi:YVTN family beta-propeller protein
VAITPDGKTAFVTKGLTNEVSTIDVKARAEKADIPVGEFPFGVAITPCRR